MAAWDNGMAQIKNLWTQLTMAQRFVLIGSTLGVVVGIFALTTWFAAAEYSVLFSNLATSDAAEIVETLKTEKIPYQITDGGKSIKVPADKVYDTRMTLASRGVPQGGGVVGYEIFDKFSFGMTNFTQRLNYMRALEGELTRTIRRIGGVEGARVHLVMPEKRLFEDQAQVPTASVVLSLKAGAALSPKQIQGVVFLVASSVEGLKAENISIVDTSGNLLHKGNEDQGAALAGNQFEYKSNFEKDTERRVRDMLERVLGMGTAVVRVSADFDFDKMEQTAEVYDPETVAVRSQSRSSESSTGANGSGAQGIPGVASNVGAASEQARAAAGGGSKSEKESETINYEISRTITKTVKSPAKLTRMSVAVVVDGSYKEPAEKGGEREFVPRTADEIAKIKSLVEKAAGMDDKRGDQVEVTSIPFRPSDIAEPEAPLLDSTVYVMAIKYGVGLIATMLFLLFFVRPFMRFLAEGPKAPTTSRVLAGAGKGAYAAAAAHAAASGQTMPSALTLDQLEAQMEAETPESASEYRLDEKTPEETLKRESLKGRIIEIVNKEPEIAANLVRSWMNEAD